MIILRIWDNTSLWVQALFDGTELDQDGKV
ncbi:MAG: hypothetical protein RJB38_2376 [Pseudomonadota bacterium]|jgi:hypothetical protein